MDFSLERKERLIAQFTLIKSIRNFFETQGFIDVMTPPVVENPGMETHIHPFEVYHANNSKTTNHFLQTSPEFAMKELLALGFEDIFNISYCFRDEPKAPHHRFQFLMLEWYRQNAHYTSIMDDVDNLFKYCVEKLQQNDIHIRNAYKNFSPQRVTVNDLFLDLLNFNLLNHLDKNDLKKYIELNHKDVPLPVKGEELSFDDYFFLLFLNKIEPQLKEIPYLLVSEFPHQLAALSTLKPTDPRVAERFEVYCYGVELCNAFNELTNLDEQIKRFDFQANEKKSLYGYSLPRPQKFYQTMEHGLPKSAGIALGIERLLLILTNSENPFWD